MSDIELNDDERKLADIEQPVALSRDAKGNLILRQQSWHDDDSIGLVARPAGTLRLGHT